MRELSLHILDIAENAVAAGAKRISVTVEEQPRADTLTITVRDDGRGMTPEQLRAVTDPFYTTRETRKVGLGVPLFKLAAEQAGGGLTVESEPGRGTVLRAVFGLSNIDRAPLGDAGATILLLISCNPSIDICYRRVLGARSFTLDTREMREELGGVSVASPEVLDWVKDYLAENESALHADEQNSPDSERL